MTLRQSTLVLAFRDAATRYCSLLECVPDNRDRWVVDILEALARLYCAAIALPDVEVPDDAPESGDRFDVGDAQWRQIYELATNIFGWQKYYWAYFDPSAPPDAAGEPVCGDLADDLADIYRDVKPGIAAWDSFEDANVANIVNGWKYPLFESHWGVHAVSAMRALHPIAYLRGIQPRE